MISHCHCACSGVHGFQPLCKQQCTGRVRASTLPAYPSHDSDGALYAKPSVQCMLYGTCALMYVCSQAEVLSRNSGMRADAAIDAVCPAGLVLTVGVPNHPTVPLRHPTVPLHLLPSTPFGPSVPRCPSLSMSTPALCEQLASRVALRHGRYSCTSPSPISIATTAHAMLNECRRAARAGRRMAMAAPAQRRPATRAQRSTLKAAAASTHRNNRDND